MIQLPFSQPGGLFRPPFPPVTEIVLLILVWCFAWLLLAFAFFGGSEG